MPSPQAIATSLGIAGASAADPTGAPATAPKLKAALSGSLTIAPFRLRRHGDFQRVYAASRKYHSANIAYFFRLRQPEERVPTGPLGLLLPVEGPRLGLTVPRALGNAVARNRIRRRMREAARLHLRVLAGDLLPNAPTLRVDLVLHPRKSVADLPMPELEREVAKLLAAVARLAPHPQPAPPPRPPRKSR